MDIRMSADRMEKIIRDVLGDECSARCMDDEDDRDATTYALMAAITRELPEPETDADADTERLGLSRVIDALA